MASAGDILIKRKVDKIQIIREPKVVLATLDAEEGLKLANDIIKHSDKILSATNAGQS